MRLANMCDASVTDLYSIKNCTHSQPLVFICYYTCHQKLYGCGCNHQ